MKYSLRKSFSSRRRKETQDDDHHSPHIDPNVRTNSISNLVKSNQSKSFLRRRRHSSSPPPSSSPDTAKLKACEHTYNNHICHEEDDDDNDDDPFSSSSKTKSRVRPLDKLTNQIRKSFRNTLTRQRSRLESTNSNKRLIMKKNGENLPADPIMPPISTGLTSPINISAPATLKTENEKTKVSPKRCKAPLAPTHMYQS